MTLNDTEKEMEKGLMNKVDAILSQGENDRLKELEIIIDRNIKGFIEVGMALAEIRESRLYRSTHDTFEAFCSDKWDIGRKYADKQIAACEVVKNIDYAHGRQNETSGHLLPANERQARPLTAFDADTQRELWQKAVDRANEIGTGKVTGAIVSAIVAEELRKKTTDKIKDTKERASREGLIDDSFNQAFQPFADTIAETINTGFKTTSKVAVLQHLDELRALVANSK